MSKFTDFAKDRAKSVGQKYVRPDGQNEGMFRDNPVDVLEELADSWNITWLWLEHYVKEYGNEARQNIIDRLFIVLDDIERLADSVDELASLCKGLKDENVDRAVPWRSSGSN